LAGWPAQLTANAFNQLAQYVNRAYCYAELAIFFPSSTC